MNSDRRGFFKKLLGLAAAVVAAPVVAKAVPSMDAAPAIYDTFNADAVIAEVESTLFDGAYYVTFTGNGTVTCATPAVITFQNPLEVKNG